MPPYNCRVCVSLEYSLEGAVHKSIGLWPNSLLHWLNSFDYACQCSRGVRGAVCKRDTHDRGPLLLKTQKLAPVVVGWDCDSIPRRWTVPCSFRKVVIEICRCRCIVVREERFDRLSWRRAQCWLRCCRLNSGRVKSCGLSGRRFGRIFTLLFRRWCRSKQRWFARRRRRRFRRGFLWRSCWSMRWIF